MIGLRSTAASAGLEVAQAGPISGPRARSVDHLSRLDALRLAASTRSLLGAGDVLHAHLPWPDRLGIVLAGRGRRPTVVTFHLLPDHPILGLKDLLLNPGLGPVLAARLSRKLAPLVFVALTHEDQRRLREIHPTARIERVPNVPAEPPGESPPPLPFGPGVRVIAVGRLCERKGFDRLLRALAAEPVRSMSFSLCIVGEGESAGELRALASSLGIAGQVHFVGQVPAAGLFRQAELFVTLSRAEGMPLALLEAMTAGIAVAASPIPAHREVLEGLRGAVLSEAPPDWPGELARLIADDGLRAELAQQARARVLERYSAAAQDDAYARLYADVTRA